MCVFPVWETKDDWVSGYIAGLLDGEGSVTLNEVKRSRQIAFSQKEGIVMSFFEDYLKEHNICYTKNTRSDGCSNLCIRTDLAKLLGLTQPRRLWEKGILAAQKRLHKPQTVEIVNIEPGGKQEVIAIETDTHTFIAEGLASHNSHDHTQNIARDNYLTVPQWEDSKIVIHRKLLVSTGAFRGYAGYPFRSGYQPSDLGTPRIRIGKRIGEDGTVRKDIHSSL